MNSIKSVKTKNSLVMLICWNPFIDEVVIHFEMQMYMIFLKKRNQIKIITILNNNCSKIIGVWYFFWLSLFYLVSIIPTQQSIFRWGAISEMRYANTKILIVTCYLLLRGWKCLRYAFVVPSLYLRISGLFQVRF